MANFPHLVKLLRSKLQRTFPLSGLPTLVKNRWSIAVAGQHPVFDFFKATKSKTDKNTTEKKSVYIISSFFPRKPKSFASRCIDRKKRLCTRSRTTPDYNTTRLTRIQRQQRPQAHCSCPRPLPSLRLYQVEEGSDVGGSVVEDSSIVVSSFILSFLIASPIGFYYLNFALVGVCMQIVFLLIFVCVIRWDVPDSVLEISLNATLI